LAQVDTGPAFEVYAGTVGRPCLLEKGCLIHVDAKAKATETVPSTRG
jgi:hypothetical protein